MRHAQQPTTAVRIGLIAVVALVGLAAGATGSVAADAPTADDIRVIPAVNQSDPVWSDFDRNATIDIEGFALTDFDPSKVSVSGDGDAMTRVYNDSQLVSYSGSPGDIGDAETVDILYDGSVIETVTVETVEWDTVGVSVNSSTLEGAESVNVTLPKNETTSHGLTRVNSSTRQLQIGLSSATKTDRIILADVPNRSTTVDITEISYEFERDYQDLVNSTPSDQQVTLVTSDAVESVEIDGETVYDQDDSLLGGGGGDDGLGDQTLIGIGVAVVAILLLARD
jgi:hypothetical protein